MFDTEFLCISKETTVDCSGAGIQIAIPIAEAINRNKSTSTTGIELISADRRRNCVYENSDRNRYLLKLEDEIKLQEIGKKISFRREVIINEYVVNKLQEIRRYKLYNSIRRLKFLCKLFRYTSFCIIIFLQTFLEHSIPIEITISVSKLLFL